MKVRLCLLTLLLAMSSTSIGYAEVSCSTNLCHKSIVDTQNLHEPLKNGDCSSCHKQTNPTHPLKGSKGFTLNAKDAALCYQCHSPFGIKKKLHPPVKDGECNYCHNPHGGVGRALLADSENQSELCFGCHNPDSFKKRMQHGPVAVGACSKCHDPHESSNKALLKFEARETCLKCHNDFQNDLKSAIFVHPPVKTGSCTSCHSPHSSDANSLLKKKMPDICMDCHSKIQKKLQLKFIHKPVEKGCGSCHSVHFSKAAKLLPGNDKDVCLGCHGTDKLGTPPLRNIKKDIEGKKYLHGPIASGDCKACHDPHASDNFRLLKGKYPATQYAPYKDGTYELCLGCHEKNLLRFGETTIYTKFRNGNRNLHYVHVVNQKGRTCRICHQAHASNGEKLINKEGSQFGDWKIPMNFKTSTTGGSCAPGCHRAFVYDRESPVVYPSATQKKK